MDPPPPKAATQYKRLFEDYIAYRASEDGTHLTYGMVLEELKKGALALESLFEATAVARTYKDLER